MSKIYFLFSLEYAKAKAFVKSRKPDKKAMNIKFIGKIKLKLMPFFLGKKIPRIKI